MKNILISGGAGYFGTFLTQQLLKDYNVTVYDLFYFPWLTRNKKKIKHSERLKFKKKHLKDVKVDDFKDIDIVLDLNGISNDPSSELNPGHTWKLNNTYRKKFAIAARKAGVKRYIFNSTCSIYGFSKKSLKEFCNLDDAPIEDIEGLEQLRAIHHQKKITMLKVTSTGFGIDTKEDLARAIEIFL